MRGFIAARVDQTTGHKPAPRLNQRSVQLFALTPSFHGRFRKSSEDMISERLGLSRKPKDVLGQGFRDGYTALVRATDGDGVWFTSPDSIHFAIWVKHALG